MATLNDLRAALSALLGLPAVPGILQLNNNTRERAFECYVFALVLRSVRQAGGTVELHGIASGRNPNPLVFRGGPGHMGSRAQDFCYARCVLSGREFEVHVDVVYLGSSGATHEVDVSLCDRSAADAVRRTPGMLPDTRKLRAAMECRFYDSQLGTALGRTFVGLVDDCGRLVVKTFVTNGRSAPLAAYFSKASRPEVFFEVSPVIAGGRDRLIRVVEQALRRWAGSHRLHHASGGKGTATSMATSERRLSREGADKTAHGGPAVSVASYREDPLYPRVARAVDAVLQRGKVVVPVDVLVGMRLLTPEHFEEWRRGRVPYLERVINCNLTRLSRLLRILRFHAHDLNLVPSATVYTRWGKGPKRRLRFTKTGDPKVEEVYATHFVWPGKGPFHPPVPKESERG